MASLYLVHGHAANRLVLADDGDVRIVVDACQPLHSLSRHLTGACIEDVNHEIYGGLYSQMIFGESFQEPAPPVPVSGFETLGGEWQVDDAVLSGGAGDGPKLASMLPPFTDGDVQVEIRFDDANDGNSGLLLRLSQAGVGADNFDGYEVSLVPSRQVLTLGRHRHNWEFIRDVPCRVKLHEWNHLHVKLRGNELEVLVNGESVTRFVDGELTLKKGTIGLRQWQRTAKYRNLRVTIDEQTRSIPFDQPRAARTEQVSRMWRPVHSDGARGSWSLAHDQPFVSSQYQQMALLKETGEAGAREVGIENQGLNRTGLHIVRNKAYEGSLWARAVMPVQLIVTLEDEAGAHVAAEQTLSINSPQWQRVEFQLMPNVELSKGRFAIKLRQPGAVSLGYVELHPGSWGQFKGLPVRRDVAEAIIDQGVTVLRYGGSMVNNPNYLWKNMIGPRAQRQPYRGHWYAHSTNGFGILDFLNFCEAAGLEAIPAFSMHQTPEDMRDFIEYAKGDGKSGWSQRRVADGHPTPYRLKYLQLGNEERVDLAYAAKFEAMARLIWAIDPEIVLVVGDFVYSQPINNPFDFTGAASGITSLEGQQRILKLAREVRREVWFDVHVGTDGPRPDSSFDSMFTFQAALEKIAEGASFKVVVFEFNSGNHTQRRALANALAIQAIERNGRIPIAAAANCLQVDGQNDNGWDQGLLFMNSEKVWLQPPGYVTQMFSRTYLPKLVRCEVQEDTLRLDCNAKVSNDGGQLVIQVVNPTERPADTRLEIKGFVPKKPLAELTELAAPPSSANSAANPERVSPVRMHFNHKLENGTTRLPVPAHSVVTIRFE